MLLMLPRPHPHTRPYSSQLMEAAPALAVAGGANTITRRLVLTSSLLLERRIDSYDVVSSRPLGKVAALVRFVDDPKLMAVEWSEGSRPTMFTSVARDAILAALLDAAQVRAGVCIGSAQQAGRVACLGVARCSCVGSEGASSATPHKTRRARHSSPHPMLTIAKSPHCAATCMLCPLTCLPPSFPPRWPPAGPSLCCPA
jgi:hypothetical protein